MRFVAQTIKPAETAALAALVADYARALAARRARTIQGLALLVLCILVAGWAAEVRPLTFLTKFPAFTRYIDSILTLDSGGRVWTSPVDWFWGLGRWLKLLGETLLMAYVGTLAGAVIAFVLCFTACANLVRSRRVVFVMRRLLEFGRTVPELAFALIFVYSFGLGPVPGVLAIAIHTIGALGKLFAEVVENIDMKPVEGIASAGGTWVQQIRFAVLPQVQSNFLSYALLRFEINVRGAAVMGFVGAGGIGDTLITSIRKFYYSDVSALLVLIIATVMLIDTGTERLRHSLIGPERTR
jgi:phosphonate transport system permease protein